MNLEYFRNYCLSKKGVSEEFPFDEQTLVFKVGSKLFALTDIEGIPFSVNLKCEPEKAAELRERYDAIKPGYHMNKKHWITVSSGPSISDALFIELTDKSYDLVFAGLKKSEKEKIFSTID